MAVGAMLAMAVLASAMPQEDASPVTEGEAFQIELPTNGVMTRQTRIDFGIYEVVLDGRPVAGFYEGFAADVSDWVVDREQTERQQRSLDGGAAEYFWSRPCMPTQVHGWTYGGLSETDAARAKQMIDSVQTKPCD